MSDRLYRILLRLLPARFDQRDREEMWETHRSRVRQARETGGDRAATRLRRRELLDLLGTLLSSVPISTGFDSLRQDIRLGARSLLRSPIPSGLAVVSLALGVGATSAIFGAVDVWLLRPLPLPNSDRLISVGMANRAEGRASNPFSIPDLVDWQRESERVELGAWRQVSFNLSAGDEAQLADGAQVSHNLPAVLGMRPVIGRSFSEEEGTAEGPRVAMLTHAFWTSALGADPAIVGQPVVLDGRPHSVIGVLPADQGIPGLHVDLWVPLRVSADEPRGGHSLWGVGLLDEGSSLEAARAEFDAVAERVAVQDPDRTFPNAAVVPLREGVYGEEFEQGGLVIAAAVAFVLLIACVNIANLLLARGFGRTHEVAVRGALGATRSRLARQLVTENLLIGVTGGLLAIGTTYLCTYLLRVYVLMPPGVPGWNLIEVDGRVLTATAVATLVSVLVFGLLPALRESRIELGPRLAEGVRTSPGRRRGRLVSALVVGEIAASMALLTACGLLIRQLAELNTTEMDMRTEDALVFRVSVPSTSRETIAEAKLFTDQFAERVASLPGVTGIARASGHPLQSWSTSLYRVPGVDGANETARLSAEVRRASASYLEVMDLEMVAGRWFDETLDVEGSLPVAVVSRALADRWWSDPNDALGETVDRGSARTIVGVVDAGRLRGPQSPPPPVIFEPIEQGPSRYTFFVASHQPGTANLAEAVRGVLREMDPSLAVVEPQAIESLFADALGPQRAALQVLGALAALALVLTLVGVYGVIAHSVGQRKREMGLRIALGATGARVTRLVLGRSVRLAAAGLVIGTGLSLLAGQGLAFILVGVSPRDPVAIASVISLLFTAIVIASYLPARHAGRSDPLETLKGHPPL